MSRPIEEVLAPKSEVRPRIYAYSIDDKAHAGLLKVGLKWFSKNGQRKKSVNSEPSQGFP